MANRLLPAKDRSIAAAIYYGGGREAEYRVEGNSGLVLVVMKPNRRGQTARVWRCYYSRTIGHIRRKRKIRLGAYPQLGLADARARAAEIMSAVDRGLDPIELASSGLECDKASHLTFSDLLVDYLIDRSDLASAGELRRELHKDLLPSLGNRHPSSIAPADIDTVASEVMRRGAPAMARRIITHVKAIFNYCLLDAPRLAEKYQIRTNPAQHLGRRRRGATSRYSASKPRQRVLGDAEIPAWSQALLESNTRADIKLMLLLILTTAQRPGEIRQLTIDQLTLRSSEPTWVIPETITKNGRRHIVPLSALAVRLLLRSAETARSNSYLFPANNSDVPKSKAVLPMAMGTIFRKHLPHMSPATAHDLRRSAATGMRRIGVPSEVVSMILNHSRTDVTGRHYDHYDALPERVAALNMWGGHLERHFRNLSNSGLV